MEKEIIVTLRDKACEMEKISHHVTIPCDTHTILREKTGNVPSAIRRAGDECFIEDKGASLPNCEKLAIFSSYSELSSSTFRLLVSGFSLVCDDV